MLALDFLKEALGAPYQDEGRGLKSSSCYKHTKLTSFFISPHPITIENGTVDFTFLGNKSNNSYSKFFKVALHSISSNTKLMIYGQTLRRIFSIYH